MALSIDELTRVLTEDEVLDTWLGILETTGLPARSWRKAGKLRTLMRIFARTYAGFTEVMAAFIKSGFLDTATKVWLTLLARYVYGVERIPSTFATGLVVMTNTGGGTFNKGAGEVTVLWEAGKKAYVNVDPISLVALSSQAVAFQAVEAGSASSVEAGGIAKLETVMTGVRVENLVALVGSDEETDPTLRQRCRDKLDTLSANGPRGAYDYAVRTATRLDGTFVDINRVAPSPSSDTGVQTVYVASPSGPPIPTDLPIIADSCDRKARPDVVKVVILPATPIVVSRRFTVWAKSTSGLGEESIRRPANDALLALVSAYPIGGIKKTPASPAYLFIDRLKAAISNAHPAVFDVDADDDTDIPLSPGQVATLAAVIDVRFVEVP